MRSVRSRHRQRVALSAGAVLLAACAVYVQWRVRQAERDNPPQGQFIDVDGVRLHYVEQGEGPPLVIFHGNGSMFEEIQRSGVMARLAHDYRVILIDRPGFGHSERPADRVWTARAQARLMREALRQLKVERPIVVGHSWGVFVALRLALADPHYVRSLVLASGYYFPTPRLDVLLMSAPAIPLIGDLVRHTVSPLLSRIIYPLLLRRSFGPAPVSEGFRGFPVWMALRPRQLKAAAAETAMMIPTAATLGPRFAELRMPVVLIAGEGDRVARALAFGAGARPHSAQRAAAGAGSRAHGASQRARGSAGGGRGRRQGCLVIPWTVQHSLAESRRA
ncbi:MAG: alpha/beta hydrolase [Burkholderiales bacterium]|nr:alpha/beta hydrolase [Burkholderiales bacterium]